MMFPGPSLAERARTTVRLSPTLQLSTETGCGDADRHGTDEIGSLVLVVPEEHAVAIAARASSGGLAAEVEATDMCPVPVPDRVRGRTRLTGWVHEPATFLRRPLAMRTAERGNIGDLSELLDIGHGHTVLYVNITEVSVRIGRGAAVTVPPGDYAVADADPLARDEASLLAHLTRAHPEELARLVSLVPEPVRAVAGRVQPIRLDRYGVVLRAGAADVRLPFAEPLDCRHELPGRMRELLARAEAHAGAAAG
jgi:hypothetical protein